MLCVTFKPFMLSVVMLNVVIQVILAPKMGSFDCVQLNEITILIF